MMNSKNYQKAYAFFCETINKYDLFPQDRTKVVIFFSGGKDASLLSDLLVEYKQNSRPNLTITLLTAAFPEMIYNSEDLRQREHVTETIKYWEERGCTHKMVETPEGIGDHLFDNQDVPCEICEKTKTKILFNELLKDEYRDSIVCQALTVEDIAGYLLEIFYLTGKYANWQELQAKNPKLFIRAMELCWKVYPKYAPQVHDTNIINCKPLIEFEEDLIRLIRNENKYPEIPEYCSDIRGEKFKMYKRFSMQGFDQLRSRYKNSSEIYDNLIFRDYQAILKRYQDMGLIPTVKEIENMKIEARLQFK